MRNFFRGLAPIGLLALCTLPAKAQTPESPHRLSPFVSAMGGAGYFGRFLGQDFEEGQRKLKGKTVGDVGGGISVGAAAGRNAGQVGVFFLPTTLRWSDDTGRDSDALDVDDLVDLDAYVLSAEFVHFLANPDEYNIVPYTMTGVTATYWKLGDTTGPIEGAGADGSDDAIFKYGVTAGFGVQIQTGHALALKIGLNTAKLGNPFTGKNSFQAVDGHTFDEPGTVTSIAGYLGLTYTFGR